MLQLPGQAAVHAGGHNVDTPGQLPDLQRLYRCRGFDGRGSEPRCQGLHQPLACRGPPQVRQRPMLVVDHLTADDNGFGLGVGERRGHVVGEQAGVMESQLLCQPLAEGMAGDLLDRQPGQAKVLAAVQ